MSELVKHPAVQIDNRLSELFLSRKRGQESESAQVNDPVDSSDAAENAWLLNFGTSSDAVNYDLDESESMTTFKFQVNKSEVRPFWRPKNSKAMKQIWLKAKASLSKDCQKQRKAALRKTVVR